MVLLLLSLFGASDAVRDPALVIFVARHGVRRQFASSTFPFDLYAPNKTFAQATRDTPAGLA